MVLPSLQLQSNSLFELQTFPHSGIITLIILLMKWHLKKNPFNVLSPLYLEASFAAQSIIGLFLGYNYCVGTGSIFRCPIVLNKEKESGEKQFDALLKCVCVWLCVFIIMDVPLI